MLGKVVLACAKPEILEPGETLTYPRLPGLTIDVALLFAL